MSNQTPLQAFRRRYILPFIAVLAILAVVFVWLLLRQQVELLDAELEKKGESTIDDFIKLNYEPMMLYDADRIKSIIEQTITDDIHRAAIFSLDGSVMYGDSSFALPPKLNSYQEATNINQDSVWIFLQPTLDINGDQNGIAAIELSRERVIKMLNVAAVKLIATTAIIALIIAIVVYWLLVRLRKLADEEIQRAKEIETAFNKLQELQVTLRRANETLEANVKERTKELEKINTELQQVNNELKDFAYIVSHDLKAPLRSITSLTDWIVEEYHSKFDEDGREQMSLLKDRVNRMYQLLEGILRYSRIGRGEEFKEIVDTHDIVLEVISILMPSENFEITITSDQLPKVFCDRTKIHQVFQNLVSNAIKYNDKPVGIIEISVETKPDGFHYFSVKDNGKGIAKRDFDRVFKIFQTLEADKQSMESTGVGLTLVKKIIRKYGGDIYLDSVVGESTTFTFTLPAIKEPIEESFNAFNL